MFLLYKMKSGNIEFYLNILEISGKNITDTYVNDIRRHLDEKQLKYKFEIITDENFYDTDKHTMYGGKTTFPYNYFKRAFDSIQLPKTKNTKTMNQYDKVLDNDTNNKTPDNTVVETTDDTIENETHDTYYDNTIMDRITKYNPVDLDDTIKQKTTKKEKPIELTIPNEYTGVIHVLLTIFNIKNIETISQGGIKQLTRFLESYNNKKEV